MNFSHTNIIEHGELSFAIVTTDLSDNGGVNDVTELARPIILDLLPFIKLPNQVIIVRDQPGATIENLYPGGHTYFPNETQIAVPSWPADEVQLKSTLAHELHHMARWQNGGYGRTLGEAIISEGVASFYEQTKSGWTPPWTQAKLTDEIWAKIKSSWKNDPYNHSDWFFNGPDGQWIGYTAGYLLAQRYYKDRFDLGHSITASASEFLALI
jgi:hypothetical protein